MRRSIISACLLVLPFQMASAGALDLVTGNWGIAPETVPEDLDAEEMERLRGCKASPVIISANRKNMRYKAIHTGEDDFVANADILDINEKWISIRYDDEDRLMENGEPQIWHMFFVSQDKFYWIVGPGITADKREGVVAGARVRCQSKIS